MTMTRTLQTQSGQRKFTIQKGPKHSQHGSTECSCVKRLLCTIVYFLTLLFIFSLNLQLDLNFLYKCFKFIILCITLKNSILPQRTLILQNLQFEAKCIASIIFTDKLPHHHHQPPCKKSSPQSLPLFFIDFHTQEMKIQITTIDGTSPPSTALTLTLLLVFKTSRLLFCNPPDRSKVNRLSLEKKSHFRSSSQ